MSYYDDASLVVIPSGYKTSKVYAEKPTDGSGDLAFTRTGDTATRVNSAGLIEKVRTNLALNSEGNVNTYNTAINVSNAASSFSSFANAIQIPSTGTSVAYKSVVTTAQPYSISVYVKMDDNSVPILSSSTTSGNVSLIIAGSFATDNLKVESVGNNVYRLSGSAIGSGASNNNGVVRYDTQTLKSFKIAGIQLEVGDVATAYIKTTSAAVSVGPVANVPRLDYTGSTCPRLLLEPQRTNLVFYSEQFNNAYWGKLNTSVDSNVTTSPDGYINADRLKDDAVSGSHYVASSAITVTNATQYSFTAYLKADTLTWVRLELFSGGCFFNLSNGTLGTASGATATITSVGNGWYRCSVMATSASTTAYPAIRLTTGNGVFGYAGNGSGLFVWGAQLELGAYATSYIPTLAASATRGVDDATKTGITSLIGQTEGTLFLDFQGGANDSANHFIGFSDGTTGNRIVIVRSSANTLYAQIRVGGVEQALIQTVTLTENTRYKCAVAYKANDVVFYVNGAQVGTDTSATIPATSVFATNTGVGSSYFERTINQSLVFKTRLTNAELAALTTI